MPHPVSSTSKKAYSPGDGTGRMRAGAVSEGAASIAPVRLRADLELWREDRVEERPITYVVYITSEDRYHAVVYELAQRFEQRFVGHFSFSRQPLHLPASFLSKRQMPLSHLGGIVIEL